VAVAKAKRESGEGDREVEAAPEVSPSPRSKDQVIDKMIQVMERLERKMKELEDRLKAAEAKITRLMADKPPRD
jgi:predicted RNase H-like nuclease (RuvC/YqgF family)